MGLKSLKQGHAWLLLLTAALLPDLATATEQLAYFPLGNAELTLTTSEDQMQVLRQGERVLFDDAYLRPGEQLLVGDTFLRVLTISTGGSVCAESMAVLWEEDGLVRQSEPTDSCTLPEVRVEGDALRLSLKPLPGTPGLVWGWNPEQGLYALPSLPFSPDESRGWEALPAMANAHPIEVFALAPIYRQFEAALPPSDFAALALTLAELGSGQMREEGYEGQACLKWECGEVYAWLWADPATEMAYAFWQNGESAGAAPLPLEDWPIWVILRAAERLP